MKAFAALVALTAAPALAEVRDSGPAHFSIERSALVPADPQQVYELLLQPQLWWNGQHSYSGDPANLSLDPEGTRCFCERIPAKDGKPAGWVEHMRVIHARPGETLRLSGGLGPLQAAAVTGTLTWSVTADGQGTRLTWTYLVAGHIPGGAAAIAGPVDRVLGEQLQRLASRFGDKQREGRD